MSAIPTNFGQGGANLSPQDAQGAPSLVTVLREVADDLAAVGVPVPAWDAGVAVSANAVTLPTAGHVIAVHVTAAGVTGIVNQLSTGVPATKQVTITYAASGVPTLTFAAGDAVTAISVLQLKRTASYVIKTTKAL
jgi:hypothetical protein